MNRAVLLLLATLVLAAGVWLALRADGSAEGAGVAAPGSGVAADARDFGVDPAVVAVETDPQREVESVTRASAVEVRPVADTSSAASRTGLQTLRGQVVVLLNGERIEELSGSVTLAQFGGIQGTQHDVDVREGRFELPVDGQLDPATLMLKVAQGRLGAFRVIGVEDAVGVGAEGEWSLEARPVYGPRFEIVAAESGDALIDGVVHTLAVTRGLFEEPGSLHPEGALGRKLAGPGPSPLTVPLDEVLERYLNGVAIGAPGRVWQWARLDPKRQRPLRVELERGGAVEVTVTGFDPERDEGLTLRMRQTVDEPFLQRALVEAEPFTLELLPPGSWTFEVVRGDRWRATVFAGAQVEVRAGATVPVRLNIDEQQLAEAPLYPTTLEVRLAPGWPGSGFDWRTARQAPPDGRTHARSGTVDQHETESDGTSVARIDLGDLPIGDYALYLAQATLAAAFEVDGSGTSYVTLGEPLALEVRIVRGDGETPVEGADVSWIGRFPGVSDGTQIEFGEREPGSYRAKGQPGKGQLMVMRPGGGVLFEEWEVRLGGELFELVVPETVSVEVRFVLDGNPLELPFDARLPMVERVDGATVNASLAPGPTSTQLIVPAPGRYRITASASDGYDAPLPIELTVEPGDAPSVELVYLRSSD